MRRVVTGIALVVLLVPGCYSNRITRPDAWPGATETHSEVVWSFWWGAQQQNINPTCCQGPGLARVTVRRDVGQGLITLLTLGIAAPITIEWQCAKNAAALLEPPDDF